MGDDVDPVCVAKHMKHVFCSCSDNEKHPTCYGCGKCYMQLLEEYNNTRKIKNKKAQHVWPDFETYDDFITSQPDFGVFRWFCSRCENILHKDLQQMKMLAHDNAMPSGDSVIGKLQNDFVLMNAKLDEIVKKINETPALSKETSSPPRKFAKVAWSGSNDEPTIRTASLLPCNVNNALENASHNSKFSKTPTVKKDDDQLQNDFVINLKIKDDCTCTGSILKSLHDNRTSMPEFCGRKKFNGSHDLLFKSYSDACQAKLMLDSKLNNFKIGKPKLDKLHRYNLVGLDFDMSLSEVIDSLVRENKWLNLERVSDDTVIIKGDPKSVITVKKVTKCRNISSFMCYMLMSPNMENTIGLKKLTLGYIKCKLYKQSMKRRCYRCQQSDHFAAECKNKLCCPRCSLEHRAENCDSTVFKCINCVNGSKDDIKHPVYSILCPYNLSS